MGLTVRRLLVAAIVLGIIAAVRAYVELMDQLDEEDRVT